MEISFVKKNPLQDLLSSPIAVISTNERNWILEGHVIFELRYNQINQLKNPIDSVHDFPLALELQNSI